MCLHLFVFQLIKLFVLILTQKPQVSNSDPNIPLGLFKPLFSLLVRFLSSHLRRSTLSRLMALSLIWGRYPFIFLSFTCCRVGDVFILPILW
ncbi:hypothetical protein HanPI659440_Chr12g0468881 [Helianthus annuus]|nr:hypothetical protein HanPI659440_Chr12g0468881 [Helianthus annuus]